MPVTVNGVGTHYYGKRNRTSRTGVCRACGNKAALESYDTRLWFVFVFIPVIPLGRKRIIDQCSICQRHFVANQAAFEMSKQLNVSGVQERYRAQPSPENALEVHGCLLAFHQHAEAEQFRRQALAQYPYSAVLHVGMALHLVEIGRGNEALPLFEKAFALDPDLPEARVGVARLRMSDGKLDEARELLRFLEVAGAGQLYSLEPLESLAYAYQRAGRHAETLALCQHLLTEFPAVGDDRGFRKFVAVSEKALRRDESVLPKQSFSPASLFDAKSGRYSKGQRRMAIAALVAVLVVVGLAIANEYRRRHRTVYALSDCGQPVQVTIDDDPPVEVDGLTKIQLAEGPHRVRVGEPVNDEFEFEMSTGYFERWTKTPGFVLNVDGGAALVAETLRYAAKPRPSEFKLVIGERFFYLPDVDYLFRTAPATLKVDSKTGEVIKVRLDRASESASEMFEYAVHAVDPAAALRFGEARLRRNPDDAPLLNAYVEAAHGAAAAERAGQFLRTGLQRRPVVVPWHRAYQQLARMAGKEEGMAVEYDALLRKEPDSAALLYLRGRIDAVPAKSQEFFQRACKADASCPWPLMALAYDAASRGDWQQSRTLADKAFALQLTDPSLLHVRHTARLAAGDGAAMEAEYRQTLQSAPPRDRTVALLNLCDVLASQGKGDAARQAVADWEQQLPVEARTSDLPAECRRYVAYMTGDFDTLQQMQPGADSRSSPELRLHVLAVTGRPQDLVQDAELQPLLKEPWNALAVSLAFHLAGSQAEADAWREKACAAMDGQDADAKRAAALLRSATAPAQKQLDDIILPPNIKAMLVAALAVRFPPQKEELVALARRLNVARLPPCRLVEKVLEERR